MAGYLEMGSPVQSNQINSFSLTSGIKYRAGLFYQE
jgi:hypothetical protein